MLSKEIFLYRLSLIKYIFENSKIESKKPEPLCITALLMIHDSIELFLQLVVEYLDIQCGQPNFMDYWDLVGSSKIEIELTQKESMKRLNKSRVAFKHHGTMPSRFDIDSFLSISDSFYAENCKKVFGIKFDDISMIELITDRDIKTILENAKIDLFSNRFNDSMEKCTIAFCKMIKKYESNKLTKYQRSVFNITEDTSFLSSFFIGLNSGNVFGVERKIGEFIDKTNKSIKQLQETIKILGYGIDFRKYALFNHIVPYHYETLDGKIHFDHERNYSIEDINYCIDFCIECFLKLISFDFSLSTANENTK